MKNIEQLMELYQKYFFLPDPGVVALACATIISNRMSGDPVWLMIVGASSGGKSEIINAMTGLTGFVHPISTLTSNTFLSGMKSGGKETSLLKKIGPAGVLAMKDFTSILSLGPDTQVAVMGQLREIYDGSIVKETGTGDKLEWHGKLNLIAGSTDAIYLVEGKFNEMGSRWITYTMKEQDREETTRRALNNDGKINEYRKEIADEFAKYNEYMISNIPSEPVILEDELLEDIIKLTNFSALARTPTNRNFRGEIMLSLSPELPMRLAKQCSMLARTFTYMNDMKPPTQFYHLIHQVAIDTIPKQKRLAIETLAGYDEVTTSGVATKLAYPTSTVRTWLEDLNVRNIVIRKSGSGGDRWSLNKKHRPLIDKFFSVNFEGGLLEGEGGMDEIDDGYEPISRQWKDDVHEEDHVGQEAMAFEKQKVEDEFNKF